MSCAVVGYVGISMLFSDITLLKFILFVATICLLFIYSIID